MINVLASSILLNDKTRNKLYSLYGMKIGNAWIRSGCSFISNNITIGDGTNVNANCVFNNSAEIIIGKKCDIAFNVMFICSTHEVAQEERRAGSMVYKGIVIGDGCWIGANVTILPGVKIGEGCIIGAGSVVTKSCEAHGVYAGVPARFIRKLSVDQWKSLKAE